MTRVLAITPQIKERIKEMMAKAEQHPVTFDIVKAGVINENKGMKMHVKLTDRKPGFERPFSEHLEIPFGFRVAYSVEEQPGGLCGHLSISVDAKGKMPHPQAVEMIAAEFGMSIDTADGGWIEEFEPGHDAINLVQLKTPKVKQ